MSPWLTPQLALRSAAKSASLEDLRRIHPDSYLERVSGGDKR